MAEIVETTTAEMPFDSGHETRLEWVYRRGEPQRVRSYCDCGWTTPDLGDAAIARQLAAEHLPPRA